MEQTAGLPGGEREEVAARAWALLGRVHREHPGSVAVGRVVFDRADGQDDDRAGLGEHRDGEPLGLELGCALLHPGQATRTRGDLRGGSSCASSSQRSRASSPAGSGGQGTSRSRSG